MAKINRLILLISSFLFVSCTSITEKKFSDYYELDAHNPEISVFLDVVILSDIEGSKVGFNEEKNQKLLEISVEEVTRALKVRGFKPSFVVVSNGAFLDINPEIFFYSRDFKSTGHPFSGYKPKEGELRWINTEVQTFFGRLSERAPHENKSQYRSQPPPRIRASEVPAVFDELSTDKFIYIKVGANDMSKAKLLTAVLSSALITYPLTGGMYSLYLGPAAGAKIEIITFDTETNKIMWWDTYEVYDHKYADQGILKAFQLYPTTTGEKIKPEKRERAYAP